MARRMEARRRGSTLRRGVDGTIERLGASSSTSKALRKVFPNHFSFLWGEIALYAFLVLVVTGIYLTFFYEGSQQQLVYDGDYEPMRGRTVSAAYDSVLRTSLEVKGGLLIRQMHHWAALIFVAAVALHMARVYFTGAFRRPREPNWVIGAILLVLALAAGFTGYSLPDDLLSGTGLRITYSIILAIPFVGERLSYAVFGGEWPGTDIIGRLYPIHILVLPLLIFGVVAVHLGILVRQKHTQFPGPGRSERNVVGERVWPGFAMKSVGLLLLTAGVATAMGALLEVNPVWLYGPYEPGAATSYAQPDWYIGFLEGSLRLMPPWEIRVGGFVINNLVFAGMLVPGVLFGAVFVVPWIERRVTRDQREHHLLDRPREAPRRTASGAAGLTFVTVLFIGGAQDVVAGTLDTGVGHVTTVLQIASIVAPVVAWVVTWRVCLALQRRPRPERTERSVVVRRAPSGAYEAIHDRDAGHDGELAAGTARATTIDEVTGR
jgi:ubiquinol-cytochrome c reductase cytochrome b subunit